MHFNFHRRGLLALAALPLLTKAAQAIALDAPTADAELTSTSMTGKALRVIKPGDMVTMDYSQDRVNIEIDEHNKITRVYVG